MKGKYLLGFDCGTYESKGVICDFDGRIVAVASEKHILLMPSKGYAEHDPLHEWWHDFKKIVKTLIDKGDIENGEIAAVGISTVMAGIVAVDENINPLRNAILYGIDTRCVSQAEELNRTIGKTKIREICGDDCTHESFGPKILWIRQNEPEIYGKTKHFTMASGFLTAKLTGKFAVDKYSAGSAHPMINYRKNEWEPELCKSVCDMSMLPEIKNTTEVIGTVTVEASAETGLPRDIPVICGTTDGGAEALSIGIVEAGDTMIMYGSTAFINSLSNKVDKTIGVWSGPYVIEGLAANAAGMSTAGSLTRWLRDNIAQDLVQREKDGEINAYDELFREAENVSLGSEGLVTLPYFLGERMPIQDPNAKGVIFGLNMSHKRGHIVHSALEGVGYGISQIIDLYHEHNFNIESAIAVGGGTKNIGWIQIVSDICGIKQVIPEITVGAAYGDALLAGLGAGVIASPVDIKSMNKPRLIIQPDPAKYKEYKKYRAIFRELYDRNKDLMHQL